MSALLEKPVLDRKGQKDQELIVPLAEQLWSIALLPSSREGRLFMEYYNAKTATIDLGLFRPSCHNDVVHLVSLLKRHQNKTLKELVIEVLGTTPKYPWLVKQSEDATTKVLRIAGSLWLLLSTSNWQESESLPDYVQRVQSERSSVAQPASKVVELRVSARGLNQIAGIDLIWTSDLKEHLHFDETQRSLSLFRHASFLKDRPSSGYSPEYLRETASTMALLFPYGEPSDRRWNRRARKNAEPDVEIGLSMSLSRDPKDYKYWSKQLVIIQTVFQRSKPSSLRQWYHDTRDGSQFYGFWLAVIAIILTLLFGLIQSITGILQVAAH